MIISRKNENKNSKRTRSVLQKGEKCFGSGDGLTHAHKIVNPKSRVSVWIISQSLFEDRI